MDESAIQEDKRNAQDELNREVQAERDRQSKVDEQKRTDEIVSRVSAAQEEKIRGLGMLTSKDKDELIQYNRNQESRISALENRLNEQAEWLERRVKQGDVPHVWADPRP